MADTGTNTLDLGAIVSSSLKQETSGKGGVSVKAQNPANLDALTQLLQTATGAVAAEASKQKLVMATDAKIAEARAANAVDTSAKTQAAAEAQSRLTTANQEQLAAVKDATGLDINGVLGKSIATINERYDAARNNLAIADRQKSVNFGQVLSGDYTFGDFWEAKVTHPAKMYEDKALVELQGAQAEASRIKELQGIVTGQAQVNAAAPGALYKGAVADSASIAAIQLIQSANSAKEHALAIGADYAKTVMTQSQHVQQTAYQTGTLALGVENAKRQWASLGAKDTDPAVLAGYVRVALKTLGRPDADLYTADYVAEFKKMNPKQGALIDTLASTGMQLVGHQSVTPDLPLPPALGTPAEAFGLLGAINGAKLPDGGEQFQSKLMTLASNIPATITKPADRDRALNQLAENYVEEVKMDTDNSEYGKPVLSDLTQMASMNTSEITPFNTKILKPLAAAGRTVDAVTLMAAVKSSDLPESQKIAGIVAYANGAAALTDANRRPQLGGFPYAAQLPYTAKVPSGSLFGTKDTVNLKDEKSVRDHLFRAKMYSKTAGLMSDPAPAIRKTLTAADALSHVSTDLIHKDK